MVSQRKLREMREVPQLVDEKKADGSHHYPISPDGTVGKAFSYDDTKGTDLPPDTGALPDWSDPNITRERPNNNGDAAMAALAAAAIAGREIQKKAARDHEAEAARLANTPDAAKHLSEANRHRAAEVSYDRQALAAKEASPTAPPIIVNPEPVNMPTSFTPKEAAQERRVSLRDDAGVPVDDGGEPLEPQYEEATENSSTVEERASGFPPESPTGNDMAGASYNLPQGPGEYITSDEQTHETRELQAHHAHLEAMGTAAIARQRTQKVLGQAQERKNKGLSPERAERAAGWSSQMEMRQQGIASQAKRVEDGERMREQEDVGAREYAKTQRTNAKIVQERVEEGRDIRNDSKKGAARAAEATAAATAATVALNRGDDDRSPNANEMKNDFQEAQTDTQPTEAENAAPKEAPKNAKPAAAAGVATVAAAQAAPQTTAEAAASESTTPSPIDMAERGIVQPAALPPYVQVEKSGGVTSYIFTVPEAARGLGYEATIMLGTDDGSGTGGAVAEKAWALAGEIENAIAQQAQEAAEPKVQPQGPGPLSPSQGVPVDALAALDVIPNDPVILDQEMRRAEDINYNRQEDQAARQQTKADVPDSDQGNIGSELGGLKEPLPRQENTRDKAEIDIAQRNLKDAEEAAKKEAPGPEAPAPK